MWTLLLWLVKTRLMHLGLCDLKYVESLIMLLKLYRSKRFLIPRLHGHVKITEDYEVLKFFTCQVLFLCYPGKLFWLGWWTIHTKQSPFLFIQIYLNEVHSIPFANLVESSWWAFKWYTFPENYVVLRIMCGVSFLCLDHCKESTVKVVGIARTFIRSKTFEK